MKRICITIAGLALATLMLTGCPVNQSQQQKAANAVHIALTAGVGVQNAELSAYQNHLIPADDHLIIQEGFLTLGRSATVADTCINLAATSDGVVGCVNNIISTVDNLNNDGVLHLKSAEAKADYAAAMQSIKAALSVITVVIGGK